MGSKLTAAALGGLMIGFLAILRVIPGVSIYFTCCGCLSTIVGGALAAALYVKRSPVRVRTGEGATVGALAGMIGGLIQLFFATPIAYLTNNYTVNLGGGETEETKIIALIIMGIVAAIFITIIATIGGTIGVSLFEKRKFEPTAPPYQGGNPYGGGFSGYQR